MQDRSPPARQNLLATHGRTIHWVTFSERDKGKQFFGVGFALISGTDEKAIKRKRDNEGDKGGRYDNRRHKPLAHNPSSYE